jgi:hypothetical protein
VQSPTEHEQVPHHHRCDQGDCHFLLAKTWEFPQQLELLFAFETDIRVEMPLILVCTFASQDSEAVSDKAGSRCALLQVWRI